MVQDIVESRVEKRTKGVYVPIGGKKLLTFMDDFNMPAKDTFGSQPPLELIKLWIDYGFWYDRLKQTAKQIKVYTSSITIDYITLMELVFCESSLFIIMVILLTFVDISSSQLSLISLYLGNIFCQSHWGIKVDYQLGIASFTAIYFD